MAESMRELRVRQPKPVIPLPLSNAERRRRYKDKLKEDPLSYEFYKAKQREAAKRYNHSLTEDKKQQKRLKDRLRQQFMNF